MCNKKGFKQIKFTIVFMLLVMALSGCKDDKVSTQGAAVPQSFSDSVGKMTNPEPFSIMLLSVGLGIIALSRRKRHSA